VTETTALPWDKLDWDSLQQHLRAALELPDQPVTVRQFTSGRANLTFLLDFGGCRLVVRRPPRGTIAPGAHDMKREHRVLSRLNAVYPRAPVAVHYCADTSVIGADFVVVEYRDGEVLTDSIPASMSRFVDVVRRIDYALLDAAADLHVVDVAGAGLEDLGRPTGFGQRQVAGWADRWRRVSPENAIPAMDDVAHRLADTVPSPTTTSLVHNDLKLDNCQFHPGDPDTVTSVFDWDMATLGDPLFDLGALLVSMSSNPLWGLSVEESLTRYVARSGIDVEHIDWYVAFATWRAAIVGQQLHNRYAEGETSDERLGALSGNVPELAEKALDVLSGNR
jgi:aminoglycoside phosphotransferase (APT) family kinase protein